MVALLSRSILVRFSMVAYWRCWRSPTWMVPLNECSSNLNSPLNECSSRWLLLSMNATPSWILSLINALPIECPNEPFFNECPNQLVIAISESFTNFLSSSLCMFPDCMWTAWSHFPYPNLFPHDSSATRRTLTCKTTTWWTITSSPPATLDPICISSKVTGPSSVGPHSPTLFRTKF